MSIDSSGKLIWGRPDFTRSFYVRLDDRTNPLVSQAFTIPVTQCTIDQSCYNGPAGTKDIGLCKSGTQKCSNGILGSCEGEVTPATEICDGLDNNCDGQVDEGCDKDNDLYCDSAMKCAGTYFKCSNGKCLDCDDENKNVNPGKAELCDFLDNNCDENIDEGGVCTCEKLLGLGKTGKAKILFPAEDANFFAGTSVSFIAETDGLINAYSWEFGNGQTDVNNKGSSSTTYLNKGDYAAKLKIIDNSHCENIASLTLHINPCQKKEDCENDQICQNGVCKQNETTQTIPAAEQPLIIMINSPENKVYDKKTVDLIYTTSREAACSYSLNDADYVKITANTKTIEGKEGLNRLNVKCNTTIASTQFTVKTQVQTTSLMEDVKGDVKDKSRESLLGMFKDRRIENPLSEQEAQSMLSEAVNLGKVLEVEKSLQQTGSTSIIMLNVRNLMNFKINAKLDVTIPKSIANSASELKGDFTVIQEDPVVEFDIADLTEEEMLVLEVNKIIDSSQLDGIGISTKEDLGLMLRKQKETDNAMDIKIETQEVKVDGQTVTKIRTYLEPKKTMEGVALIQNIPKCLAKQIDYLKMDERYRSQIKIINPDPLIMWQFEEITSEKYFEYEVKGVLSEDCKKQIKSLGIADELGLDIESRDYFRIILPLMVIPLLGLVIVRLHRFSDIMKKKEKEGIKAEKPIEQKKPEEKKLIMVEKVGDEEKFLQKEIEQAEEEFRKRLK